MTTDKHAEDAPHKAPHASTAPADAPTAADAPHKAPHGRIRAEGTLSGTDDAAVYAEIADHLLSQSKEPLTVAHVDRWPRDGHTIIRASCKQDAQDGTRARKALATQIADWQPDAAPERAA